MIHRYVINKERIKDAKDDIELEDILFKEREGDLQADRDKAIKIIEDFRMNNYYLTAELEQLMKEATIKSNEKSNIAYLQQNLQGRRKNYCVFFDDRRASEIRLSTSGHEVVELERRKDVKDARIQCIKCGKKTAVRCLKCDAGFCYSKKKGISDYEKKEDWCCFLKHHYFSNEELRNDWEKQVNDEEEMEEKEKEQEAVNEVGGASGGKKRTSESDNSNRKKNDNKKTPAKLKNTPPQSTQSEQSGATPIVFNINVASNIKTTAKKKS